MRAVADACGVGEQQVYKWERDAFRPSLDNLARLAGLLNVSQGFLLEGK